MNENQRSAIQRLNTKLIAELDVADVTLALKSRGILTQNHVDLIKNATPTSERRQKFLDIIINIDNGWDSFLDALVQAKQNYLRDQLESEACGIPVNQLEFHKIVLQLIPQLELY